MRCNKNKSTGTFNDISTLIIYLTLCGIKCAIFEQPFVKPSVNMLSIFTDNKTVISLNNNKNQSGHF